MSYLWPCDECDDMTFHDPICRDCYERLLGERAKLAYLARLAMHKIATDCEMYVWPSDADSWRAWVRPLRETAEEMSAMLGEPKEELTEWKLAKALEDLEGGNKGVEGEKCESYGER